MTVVACLFYLVKFVIKDVVNEQKDKLSPDIKISTRISGLSILHPMKPLTDITALLNVLTLWAIITTYFFKYTLDKLVKPEEYYDVLQTVKNVGGQLKFKPKSMVIA